MINLYLFPMLTNKISSSKDYSYWLKSLDTNILELTNENLINVFKPMSFIVPSSVAKKSIVKGRI